MEIDFISKISKVVDEDLFRRYSVHDGFIFRALTEPATVYDAILIKNPEDAPCSCPVLPSSQRTLQEHIDLINKGTGRPSRINSDKILNFYSGRRNDAPTI